MKRLPVNDPEFLPELEASTLERLASELPDPCIVVEVGTGKGNSFTAIAYGLEQHKDVKIYSVDRGECVEGRQRIKDAEVPSVWYELYQADSVLWGFKFLLPVDMVYIDGDHTFTGLSADLALWTDNLKVGGILAFDDYLPIHPGVMQAVDAWLKNDRWLEVANTGRLIAFRKL